jgi:NitT/TauT family transport system substrate-binding protein
MTPKTPSSGLNSPAVRWTAGVIAAIVLIVVLRVKPWQKPQKALDVAFIPVTCHLTCPITDYASKTTTTGTRFDAVKFSEFPSIVEALKSKKLLAGFLTVPLAMKLREQGAPIRICCLGHRNGSALVIRKEDPSTAIVGLKGKTIAIPSPLSNENFIVRKKMADEGMKPDDIKFQVLAPPDMPAALAAKAIDGFVVAEPFVSKAESDGSGRVLYLASDVWPNYISCCLVAHDDLIKEHPEQIRDLVRGIVESGEWAETNRGDAARLVAPYFRQDEKLLNKILTATPTRVSYRQLNPGDDELQKIMDMGIKLGHLKQQQKIADIIDRNFIPAEVHPAKVDMAQFTGKVHP